MLSILAPFLLSLVQGFFSPSEAALAVYRAKSAIKVRPLCSHADAGHRLE